MAKLTDTQVAEIQALCNHLSQKKIASLYGVTQQYVSLIVRRVRHAPSPRWPKISDAIAATVTNTTTLTTRQQEIPEKIPTPTPELPDWEEAYVPQPCEPTSTLPGTKARIEVYRQRVLAKQEVFHPDDATIDGHTSAVLDRVDARGHNLQGRPRGVRSSRGSRGDRRSAA